MDSVAVVAVVSALAVLAGLMWWTSPGRARRKMLSAVADELRRYAAAADRRQLWVQSDLDAEWERVVSCDGDALVFQDGSRRPALGYEIFIYAELDGTVVDFHAVGPEVPPGIDMDAVFPPDVEFGE